MEINEIKELLSVDYVDAVVDGAEDIIAAINEKHKDSQSGTLFKDIVMAQTDEEEQARVYQSVWAMFNVKVVDINFLDMKKNELVPFDAIAINMEDDALEFEYNGEKYHKADIEMVVSLN